MTKPRVIAVDCRFAANSGIGVYLRNILTRLYHIRPDWHFRLLGVPEAARKELCNHPYVTAIKLDAPYYSLSEQYALPFAIGGDADVMWSPHYNAALFAPVPLLVTIHDITHIALPDLVKGIHKKIYAHAMVQGVRLRADGILFVSEFSRRDFVEKVGKLGQPNWISYNAVGDIWKNHVRAARPIAQDYIIYVGNVKPHKNIMGLLKAFELIKNTTNINLVIVGQRDGFLGGDTKAIEAAQALGDRVLFTGKVTDAMMKAWVENARLLVLPSFYEGFGIPPLEAMAVGCPTVVSNTTSLPEVCGDASAYIDPHHPADIARVITNVLQDNAYADQLRQAGFARVKQFDWNITAQRVANAMESLFKSA